MSANNSNNHQPGNSRKRPPSSGTTSTNSISSIGVDALLTAHGKQLKVGESIAFTLIKGPRYIAASPDPVDPKAPPERFPLIAKFPESVVKPNFQQPPWRNGRLYQQDIPKPVDDSDDEAAASDAAKKQQQRWKRRKNANEPPQRQWILQEEVDFLETMVARRENKKAAQSSSSSSSSSLHKKLSSRYEGTVEANPSQYVLFLAGSTTTKNQGHDGTTIVVRSLPPSNGTIAFAQPAARQTLSLSEAELAIQDQRSGVLRTFHHRVAAASASATANAGTVGGIDGENNGGIRRLMLPKKPNNNNSKSRLLNKLKAKAKASGEEDDDDGDDVMGDVAFRNRKGGGAARKELLTSLGDGITVSDDGVLGGTNDAAFGGRGQRFGHFQAEAAVARDADAAARGGDDDAMDPLSGNNGREGERGADGAAMTEDFYQRDVQAEYDELDYDANEQFDDDDVDLGESEVVHDTSGYADDDEEDEIDDLDVEEEAVTGAEGLATVAGFKLMLAKARGEIPLQPLEGTEAAAAGMENNADETAKNAGDEPKKDENDHIAKIMAAAEKSAQAAKEKAAKQQNAAAKKATAAASAIQVDENGLRVVSLDAVRREIWLNHGSIPMKRLMKIFDIKKKHGPERQDKFRDVVKELCTMTSDPLGGRLLVLKQHYSNL